MKQQQKKLNTLNYRKRGEWLGLNGLNGLNDLDAKISKDDITWPKENMVSMYLKAKIKLKQSIWLTCC